MGKTDNVVTLKPLRKSRRNRPIVTNDNLTDYLIEPQGESRQGLMQVWVKQEIDLDPVEQPFNKEGLIDNEGIKDCHDNEEEIASPTNICCSDQKLFLAGHSNDYVLPDNVASVNETNKINFLEKQLENSNARVLELEKIVAAQKLEIKQLRRQQKKYFSPGGSVKKTDKHPVPVDRVEEREGYRSACPNCRKDLTTIKRQHDRNRHLKSCRDGSKFKCSFCPSTYSREYELKNHIQNCEMLKQNPKLFPR